MSCHAKIQPKRSAMEWNREQKKKRKCGETEN